MKVEWRGDGRKAECPSNPNYPRGISLDMSAGAKRTCDAALPYPAQGCGFFELTCATCGYSGMITAAGRADDPRSVRVACRGSGQ